MADHAHDTHDGHADHQDHEHGSMRYWLAFVALAILTGLTYGLHHVHLGSYALAVAMVIAVTKGMVVVLFFMHLWDHAGVPRMILGVTMVLLCFGMVMVFADSVTRFPLSAPHF
ncbi:MAG: cytochrome C oxidase subunit IV family protein [Polyangia bacterium]